MCEWKRGRVDDCVGAVLMTEITEVSNILPMFEVRATAITEAAASVWMVEMMRDTSMIAGYLETPRRHQQTSV